MGVDPGLRPLALHGGTTPNHELMAGSPALDAGSLEPVGFGDQACLAADQRLQSRPVDGNGDDVPRYDIGAVESSLIFADGFESGNPSSWNTVVP